MCRTPTVNSLKMVKHATFFPKASALISDFANDHVFNFSVLCFLPLWVNLNPRHRIRFKPFSSYLCFMQTSFLKARKGKRKSFIVGTISDINELLQVKALLVLIRKIHFLVFGCPEALSFHF